jgi:hypothetical protein
MKNLCLLIVAVLFIKNASAQCGTNITSTAGTCLGGCDGTITFTPASGTAPYWLSIDGVQLTSFTTSYTLTGVCPGLHTYIVHDNIMSCSDTANLSLANPPSINVSIISFSDVTCNGAGDGFVCFSALGGLPPYQYSLDGGITMGASNCFFNLPPGNDSVLAVDLNGCAGSMFFTITEPSQISINVNSIPPSCGQCDGYATSIVNGGTGPYTYTWTPGNITTPFLANFCSGNYALTVADMNGCINSLNLSYPSQCDSVWPGDANLDGVADNNDVLALGISYGATGAVRTGATNTWAGQTCLNWNNELVSGTNYKHSDCDGNGVVNADDTLPVSLNYGMTHLRPTVPLYNASIPDLYLEAMVDTTGPNQLLHVKIHLGTSAAPVPAAYGLAFTLTFDQTLVDTTTASFDYSTSVLGTIGNNLLSFQYSFYSAGAIDVAVTRTNQTDVMNIDSVIGIFEVVITDNVSAIEQLRLNITDVKAITHDENSIPLNALGDSVVIDPSFVGTPFVDPGNTINVFPSPAKDHLSVTSSIEVERAELTNELGETIFAKIVNQKNFSFDMSGVKNGMYFLQLATQQGLVRKKICVMK